MYKYFTEHTLEEHLYFAEEIQSVYATNIPQIAYIHKLFREYAKDNKDYVQYYYQTRNGLKKVYSYALFKALHEKQIG